LKTVYICGDSFGCPSLGWPFPPWPEILQKNLKNSYQVINLSMSCASNLVIRMQVDRAIVAGADFIILQCTSSTRNQGQLGVKKSHEDLLDRFIKIGEQDSEKNSRDLACYSLHSLNETCVFSSDYQHAIAEYQSRLFDLDLEIYHNQCIIESTLHKLVNSGTKFLFDQGGFENPIFGDIKAKKYFSEFDQYRSDINHWTVDAQMSKSNPHHFHIMDHNIHIQIANYYESAITQNNLQS